MKMLTHTLKNRCLAIAIFVMWLIPSVQAEIRFSGFISLEGGMVDDETAFSYKNYDEEDLTFTQNTIGLQASSDLSETLSATVQIISRGETNYAMKTEWAYLTWQATDNTKIRIGSIGTPFYMFSDFKDVGYAYAWIRPPEEVYNLPINKFDGIDIFHSATLGSLDATIEFYVGGYDDTFEISGFTVTSASRNQFGLAATLGRDWWTLRAAYHQSDLSSGIEVLPISETDTFGSFADTLRAFGLNENADLLLAQDDRATFGEFGYSIDTGRFVSVAEYIVFDYTDTVFSKDIRYYIMGGVRFGDWLFHVTTARSRDEENKPEQGISETDPAAGFIPALQGLAKSQVETRDILSLGVRWDLAPRTALKFQIDQLDDTDANTNIELDQTVFSVSLQTVF